VIAIAAVIAGFAVFSADRAWFGGRSASRQGGASTEADGPIIRRGGAIIVPEGSPYRSRIVVGAVRQKSISRSREVIGIVEPDPARTIKILSPVAGRVNELGLEVGDSVKKGQRLATIDSSDLAQVLADAEKVRATAKLTKSALDRAVGLNKAGGLALKELEQAQNDYHQAASELRRVEARLGAIGESGQISGQRQIVLTAPIDGTITSLEKAQGDYIDSAAESMLTVSNLERLWVTTSIQEKDLSFVAKDERAEISLLAYPGEVFSGQVRIVNQLLEANTRRSKIHIAFDNPYGIFKLNMFATVRFFAPPTLNVLVPDSALFLSSESMSVFVEVAPWTFRRKTIVAESDFEGATVVRGLEPGQRIVLQGGILLND
jgi:cobalt-zinc-cadmium efflux system membrane fusion protein